MQRAEGHLLAGPSGALGEGLRLADVEGKLAAAIYTAALLPHEGDGASPISDRRFEHIFRELTGAKRGGKRAHDAALGPVAWQLKVLNNLNGANPAVLMRVAPEDVADDGNARRLAKSVLTEAGRRVESSLHQLGASESRICFLWGEPKRRLMRLWEEPFAPHEIDIHRLQWRRRPSGFAGRWRGKVRLEWFRRGHQLRYYPQPPEDAIEIALPDKALSLGRLAEILAAAA